MDDAGTLLAPGQRGETFVRRPLVVVGYYKNQQATAEASSHGWHHTGDIGYLDQDNCPETVSFGSSSDLRRSSTWS
jgi:long-subunit acyl-CoA synthetase (AMP-forming)